MGILVSLSKSAGGTGEPVTGPKGVAIGAGTSPVGNTNPVGSYDTMPFTFALWLAVSQPGRPPAEWLTSTAGPILANNATPADTATLWLPGPLAAPLWRSQCS